MDTRTRHRTVTVDGVEVFYREAGDPSAPTLLLLHGFPASSYMYRDLIADLADEFHLVAPDYPGFGNSGFPPATAFEYSFEKLTSVVSAFVDAIGLDRFSLYIQDYGAPIGLRIATAQPERVRALVVQSGNAYMEGFTPLWEPLFAYATDPGPHTEPPVRALLEPDATRWQYLHGVRDETLVSPETWLLDQRALDRPGSREVQLGLFVSYKGNLELYPSFQRYFREHQPPTLITWGRHDEVFGPAGAEAYLRDLPKAELHLLDTGHYALEEEGTRIAALIRDFLRRHVA